MATQMSLEGFLKEFKNASSGSLPRRFCFMLGSGASRSSGIPSGQELVDRWDSELRVRMQDTPGAYTQWKKDNGITDSNKYEHYHTFYDELYRINPSDGQNEMEKLMDKAKPYIGYVMLSLILTQTQHNVVLTTNFDHLAENAVHDYAMTMPLVIPHEALAKYYDPNNQRPCIIKIHRDLLLSPYNGAKATEKLDPDWEPALDRLFRNYSPVFIGYAGNDGSVMRFLLDNASKFGGNGDWKTPYWMFYRNEQSCGNVSKFLDQVAGYYVCSNGFDETMYRIGECMNVKIPNQEEFLSKAKDTYSKLLDIKKSFNQYMKDERKQEKEKKEEASDFASQANKLCEKGEYILAASFYKQAVDADNENALFHAKYAETLLKIPQDGETFVDPWSEFERAVELAPMDPKIRRLYAQALEKVKPELASVEWKNAIELSNNDPFYIKDYASFQSKKMAKKK